jgi:hypothetical protein
MRYHLTLSTGGSCLGVRYPGSMAQNIHFGAVLPDEITKEIWLDFARVALKPVVHHLENHDAQIAETLGELEQVRSLLSWAVGDWLLAGIKVSGMKPGRLRQDVEKRLGLKRSLGTLSNYMMTCKDFHFSRRREDLRFSHHLEVGKFDDETQEWLLDMAEGCRRDEKGNKVPIVNGRALHVRDLKKIIAELQESGRLPRTGKGKRSEPSKSLNLKVSAEFHSYLYGLAWMRFGNHHPKRMLWWMVEQYLREHKADLDAEYAVFHKQTPTERDAHWTRISDLQRQEYRRKHPGEFRTASPSQQILTNAVST